MTCRRCAKPCSDNPRSRLDQEAILVASGQPRWRPAAAAPRFAGLRVAILRRQRRLLCRLAALARKTQFLGRQVVLDDLALDVGDGIGNLFLARCGDLLVQFLELCGQLLVGGHVCSVWFAGLNECCVRKSRRDRQSSIASYRCCSKMAAIGKGSALRRWISMIPIISSTGSANQLV